MKRLLVVIPFLVALLAPSAWAAFPVVASSNSGGTSAGTSHVVNLPASIVSGNLLLTFFGCRDTNVVISGWPAGWTSHVATNTGNAANTAHSEAELRYRVADGTEGASMTLTTDLSVACVFITFRLTGQHASAAPESGTPATGNSTTPDPPTLTPSWGAANTLWIAWTINSSNPTVTTYPTNYTGNNIRAVSTGASNVVCATSTRDLNATNDDPGTFTMSAVNNWVAVTTAIRPADVVGVGGPRRRFQ